MNWLYKIARIKLKQDECQKQFINTLYRLNPRGTLLVQPVGSMGGKQVFSLTVLFFFK